MIRRAQLHPDIAERPASTTPRLRPENIPQELRGLQHWVCWRYELRGGAWTKVPYNPATGARAKTDQSETWSNFDEALTRARTEGHDGIGFVFSAADPYCGIDLDDCLNGDGQPVAEAQEIIALLNGYAEVSPSGRGIKIWVRGSLVGGGRRASRVTGFKELEVYDKRRYFTVTGWVL